MNNQQPTDRSVKRARVSVGRLTSCLILGIALACASCNKKPGAAGGGAGKAASTGDGHDHDHDEGGHSDEVVLTKDAADRYAIKVEAAQLWLLRPTIEVPARAAFNAEAMAHVGSPLPGRVVEIKVGLGSQVASGDPLVVIESPELGEAQSDYLSKRASAQAAVPLTDLSRSLWERAKTLHDTSQGISLSEVQKREGEYKTALASQQAAEVQALAAMNRLGVLGMHGDEIAALQASGHVSPRLTVRAPLAGQVVEREITLGEVVSPDRGPLLVIADTSVYWVLADVPQARISEVGIGSKAWVRANDAASSAYESSVTFVSAQVDPATRTVQARIEVPSSALFLKPGMFVRVDLVALDPRAGEPAPVVAVPEGAIQQVEGVTSLFVPVAGEPNTFARRSVVVGKSIGGMTPIQSGLVEGELFVSSGTFILKAELGKSGAEHVH